MCQSPGKRACLLSRLDHRPVSLLANLVRRISVGFSRTGNPADTNLESKTPTMSLPLFFLTDFGYKDPYVGVMKAVALRVGVTGQMIDLSHGIPPQDVLAGSVALEDALPYLPEHCAVCAVVDPGVGTARRAIAVRQGGRYFAAPDNGLLTPVFEKDFELREIAGGGPVSPTRSSTFHGRDVFAPAAALLASGNRAWHDIGPSAYFPRKLELPPFRCFDNGQIEMSVIATDHFGNLFTNFRRKDVPKGVDLRVGRFMLGNREVGRLLSTFEDVNPGTPVVYFNSSNRLSIGLSMGNAAKFFSVSKGAYVTFIPGT